MDSLNDNEGGLVEALKELNDLKIAFDQHAIVSIADADGLIICCNDLFCQMTQYSREELLGQTHHILNSGYHSDAFFQELWKDISSGKVWRGEICNRAKNGELYWVEATIVPFLGNDGKPVKYIAIRTDITQRRLAESRIYQLAWHDSLTGLLNREFLFKELAKTIDDSPGSHEYGALILLDIDHFKDINDLMGHDLGDKLLRQVGQRLQSLAHGNEVVSRFGGDEFMILVTELGSDSQSALDQAVNLAEQIRLALGATFYINGLQIHCTCSIGLVVFDDANNNKTELVKHADMALYRAKEQGRNRVSVFDKQLQNQVLNRSILRQDLQQALRNKEFYVHYQVVVDKTLSPRGFEALVRWQHPTRGTLGPADFICLAEENGLIIPLGQWVLETACKQLVEWSKDSSTASLLLSVNVSAMQFADSRFVTSVRRILQRTGVNPSLLRLELTESVFLSDVEKNILKMNEIKELGVQVALDDFGTGYSSLQYLKRLPLDLLKLDSSFVRGLPENSEDVAITTTIIALAHSLGLRVVAEGVETEAQFNHLVELGCDLFQGYWLGRPLSVQNAVVFNPTSL
ncbi:MAG TPA: EAL domain-containing protein [Alcaligenaceae bacterium]|nr:EAL domain-containing protein [Alcaligenaceae bacterium]